MGWDVINMMHRSLNVVIIFLYYSRPTRPIPGFHDESAVQKMKYNKLGNTNMVVSGMTFGK